MYINCKGKLIDLSTPKVMGILNITPDSFFEGSRYESEKDILKAAEKMLSEEAAFLDLGAYSSRPGAKDISEAEELQRMIPAVQVVAKEFPEAILSIDTFRESVAREALDAGAAMINDISAGNLDEHMLPLIAEKQCPYVMMHMKGTPQTMKDLANYEDVSREVLFYFSEKIEAARKLGINDIIIDPGFGFAKTIAQNFELMQKLDLFQQLELPLLVGISRKSMIWKTLKIESNDALNGTTALNMFALQKGAGILRVHDVKEAVESVKLFQHLHH